MTPCSLYLSHVLTHLSIGSHLVFLLLLFLHIGCGRQAYIWICLSTYFHFWGVCVEFLGCVIIEFLFFFNWKYFFHITYSDQDFPSLISTKIFPAFPSIQFHAFSPPSPSSLHLPLTNKPIKNKKYKTQTHNPQIGKHNIQAKDK